MCTVDLELNPCSTSRVEKEVPVEVTKIVEVEKIVEKIVEKPVSTTHQLLALSSCNHKIIAHTRSSLTQDHRSHMLSSAMPRR